MRKVCQSRHLLYERTYDVPRIKTIINNWTKIKGTAIEIMTYNHTNIRKINNGNKKKCVNKGSP